MRKLVTAFALFLSPSLVSANSLILDSTSKSLEMNLSAAVSTDYVVSWADVTTTAFTPGMSEGNTSSSGDTTIVAAPAASTQRQIKWVSIRNRSTTTAVTVRLMLDVSGTEYVLGPDTTLARGESLRWDADGGLKVFTSAGVTKERSTDTTSFDGFSLTIWKVGATTEAAGRWQGMAKDSGLPGAWVPGTPGVNGVFTDCSVDTNASPAGAVEMGAPLLPDPTFGSYYLTNANANANVSHLFEVVDVLWYNTGLTATTTTAQTITFPGTLPARDQVGGTDGEGLNVAIYVTTATSNGAAITNTTLSYTDSDGNPGATATISNFPATAVAGTFVPFQLAAGDRGVQSIASITLGTSYGTGAISLVIYRALADSPVPQANIGSFMTPLQAVNQTGVHVYDGSCFWLNYMQSTTTATNATTLLTISER